MQLGNRLESTGQWDLIYYPNGNLWRQIDKTNGKPIEFVYDHANQLVAVKQYNSATASNPLWTVSFTYDAEGNRVEDVDSDGNPNNTTTWRYLVSQNHVVADLVPNGSSHDLTVRYLHGDYVDQLWGRVDVNQNQSRTLWYITDRHKSVIDIVDKNGIFYRRMKYGAFKLDVEAGTLEDRWRFTGRETEYFTGLQYNRNRWYQPSIGRWIAKDALGLDADANPYRYVRNSPTNASDPMGTGHGAPVAGPAYSADVGWSYEGAAGGALAGALVGAGVGAVAGAPAAGIGAVPGAIAGAVAGGVIGWFAGGYVVGNYVDPDASAAEKFGWGALVGVPAGIVGGFVGPAALAAAGVGSAGGATFGSVAKYVGFQAGLAAAETAVEAYVTARFGTYEDWTKFSPGEVFVKNLGINLATAGIGGKTKWGFKAAAGLWALRQGVEIAGETTYDVGVRGRDLSTSLLVNAAGSIGGDLAFRAAAMGASKAISRAAHSYDRWYQRPADRIAKALGIEACFAGDMPIRWAYGSKRADQVRKGDLLWSRDEFNPNGELALKHVEEVFVRVSPIIDLNVDGQTIRTTKEHPFFAKGKGWTPAGQLQAGDLLWTDDKRWLPVEAISDNGRVETVYNFRVADFHTYFVGSDEWGCSVWAHNQYIATNGDYNRFVRWATTKRGFTNQQADWMWGTHVKSMQLSTGGRRTFLKELRHYKRTVAGMQKRGWDLELVDFGLGKNGRKGVDLVFSQAGTGVNGRNYALVESKGVFLRPDGNVNLRWSNSVGDWQSSPVWNKDRLAAVFNQKGLGTAEGQLAFALRNRLRANIDDPSILHVAAFNNPKSQFYYWGHFKLNPF